MSGTEGTFRITYRDRDTGDNIILDFGYVTSIESSITKALSTIPLVSMGADRAFQLETGSTLQYTISFKRKSPEEFDNESKDSTHWSNAHWYTAITALVDRWQMRTDGCRMMYKPSITNPYVPQIDVNGYIKMLTRKYSNKFNELIEGTIQFIVGTMYVLSPVRDTVPDQQKYITLILHSGVSDEGDKKRYFLDDVIYCIPTSISSFKLPTTPPEWSAYAKANGKEINKWAYCGVEYLPGDFAPLVTATMLETTAIWDNQEEQEE